MRTMKRLALPALALAATLVGQPIAAHPHEGLALLAQPSTPAGATPSRETSARSSSATNAPACPFQVALELKLGQALGQSRAAPVQPGNERGLVLAYAADFDIDPWHETFFYPKDTLKLAVFDVKGQRLWQKDLGRRIPPGIWFCPVFPFDLDGDGTHELVYGHPGGNGDVVDGRGIRWVTSAERSRWPGIASTRRVSSWSVTTRTAASNSGAMPTRATPTSRRPATRIRFTARTSV